jgi:signal transduction histidine kinase
MASAEGASARSADRTTPEEEALAELEQEDPLAVAEAVRRCGDRLRANEWDPGALAKLGDKILLLSKDARPRVRQGVADAAPYLPEQVYQVIIAPLLKDRSPYVRGAAEEAARKWSALRRAAAKVEEHDARVERWYREIDRKGARAIARQIAAHETEYFVRKMCHELDSSSMAVGELVRRLQEGIDAPAIDRAELRALAGRIDERYEFFRRVLGAARSHSQPAEPSFAREDLAEILVDEASLLRGHFADRAERIAVDVSAVERPLAIEADAACLRQAFGNILKNAVEAYGARHSGPIRVTVTASATATDATVTIRDSGAGMTEHDVARAFAPFGSSKPGGTGFGLFIARRVAVAVHGGGLKLKSAPGEGTTVTMTLPLRQERPARTRRRKR